MERAWAWMPLLNDTFAQTRVYGSSMWDVKACNKMQARQGNVPFQALRTRLSLKMEGIKHKEVSYLKGILKKWQTSILTDKLPPIYPPWQRFAAFPSGQMLVQRPFGFRTPQRPAASHPPLTVSFFLLNTGMATVVMSSRLWACDAKSCHRTTACVLARSAAPQGAPGQGSSSQGAQMCTAAGPLLASHTSWKTGSTSK